MSNFSENAIISFDVPTNSLKVDDGESSVYYPILPNGILIEYSNNHLNINGFGITKPTSSYSFNIAPPHIPYIEWDKNRKEVIVGAKASDNPDLYGGSVAVGHKIGNARLFIGVDRTRGNFGVKVSIEGQQLNVEQGLVSAMLT